MALAAVADDGNLLALDQVHVGVAIVINTHGHWPFSLDVPALPCGAALLFNTLGTARDRGDTGTRDLDEAQRLHEFDEGIHLLGVAHHFEHE